MLQYRGKALLKANHMDSPFPMENSETYATLKY